MKKYKRLREDIHSVVLSGKMTGEVDDNKPLFLARAQILRDAGYIVYNPGEYLFSQLKPTYYDMISKCLAVIDALNTAPYQCAVHVVTGTVYSPGSQIEKTLAICKFKWPCLSLEELVEEIGDIPQCPICGDPDTQYDDLLGKVCCNGCESACGDGENKESIIQSVQVVVDAVEAVNEDRETDWEPRR